MTLGSAPRQADLFRSTAAYCEGRVGMSLPLWVIRAADGLAVAACLLRRVDG
jgi:hypothetical protein